MKKIILLVLLVFLIGSVSAAENSTELGINPINENNFNENSMTNNDDTVKYDDIYINNSKEVNGNGLSPENAFNTFDYHSFEILSENGTIHIADGEYEVPNNDFAYNIIGKGENTVITKFWFDASGYVNFNKKIILNNLTFKITSSNTVSYLSGNDDVGLTFTDVHYGISLDGKDFNFINCTFVNTSFVSGQWQYNNPNRDKLTDVSCACFDNCNFVDYIYDKNVLEYDTTTYGGTKVHNIEYDSSNLITAYQYSKYLFNNCNFKNLTVDVIVDSYGGQTDHSGRFDGIYIYDSNFSNCNMKSVVKARQLGSCEIVDCTYDFNVSDYVDLISPFYVNKTRQFKLNETKLVVSVKDNNVIIILMDVNASKPISFVELGIINDDKIYVYKDTDKNGQIILENLVGDFNFEFSYNGDPYKYLPTSINKTFTFTKSEPKKEDTTKTVKVVKKATKITAKKATFKTKKKSKKYTITLKAGKKAVSKVKLTLKVGKKTYKATTNSKGKATFNLKKLTKKGKYTATIKFAGNKLYKAATKKVKITVKK